MLNITQAAEHLGMSASGLRKIVARSKSRRLQGKSDANGIQYYQVGSGRIMFKEVWLDEFIARHTVTPQSDVVKKDKVSNHNQKTKVSDCGNIFGSNWGG